MDDVDDSWLEALWVQAQLAAFSNVLAQQTDGKSLHEVAAHVTRALFVMYRGVSSAAATPCHRR